MCKDLKDGRGFLVELNEHNLARAIGWVGIADSKAKFILCVILVLTGFLITQVSSTVDILVVLWKAKTYGASFFCCGLLLATFVALFVCLSFLVRIIYPKRNPHTGVASCFFYESIANIRVGEFQNTMSSMSEEDAIRGLSDQTYNVSKVVQKKFDQLSAGIVWFWIATVLVVLFSLVHTVFAKIWLSASAPGCICGAS